MKASAMKPVLIATAAGVVAFLALEAICRLMLKAGDSVVPLVVFPGTFIVFCVVFAILTRRRPGQSGAHSGS